MAIEYKLVTWAGLGTTVTFTDAGDIVNLTNHGAPSGHAFRFSGSGTPPSAFTKNSVTYYLRSTGANTFTVFPTANDAINNTNQITFTGTGSGTNQVVGEYWASLGSTDKNRYYNGSVYMVYNGLQSWWAVDSTLRDITKNIVVEIEGKWTDVNWLSSGAFAGFRSMYITTRVGGEYNPETFTHSGAYNTNSFHYGNPSLGYFFEIQRTGNSCFDLSHPNVTIDGIKMATNQTSGVSTLGVSTSTTCVNTKVINCLITKVRKGISIQASECKVFNNVIYDLFQQDAGIDNSSSSCGIYEATVPVNTIIAFNIFKNCVYGIQGGTSSYPSWSTYIGNISIGCSVQNWPIKNCTNILNGRFQAAYNFGVSARDKKTVTFENSSTPGTLTCRLTGHGLTINTPIRFLDGGGATAPGGITFGNLYYIKTVVSVDLFTLANTLVGTNPTVLSSALAYVNSGSGTINYPMIWETANNYGYLTTSDFTDYANNVLTPLSSSSPQVNVIPTSLDSRLPNYDLLVTTRPNYESASYPSNLDDAGPFEYDHGEGLAPATVTLSFKGIIAGSQLYMEKSSDSSVIINQTVSGTTYSTTYTYVGDVDVNIRIRKFGYQEWIAVGTISAGGLSITVGQAVDPTT